MSSYRHVPHPHILRRKSAGPVKVADQFSRTSPVARFNTAFWTSAIITCRPSPS